MSPRGEDANRQIREQQRARIAAAASRVFARKGLAAARISDIAAEAGVSQGLVHHYFESKEALFSELVKQLMDAARDVPAMAAKQPGTPLDRLRWYVDVTLTGMTQHPESVMLVWQALAIGGPEHELRRRIIEGGQASMSALARLIRAAQRSDEIAPGNTLRLAAHLVALMEGLALQAAIGPHPNGQPMLEVVMRLLGPKQTRRKPR